MVVVNPLMHRPSNGSSISEISDLEWGAEVRNPLSRRTSQELSPLPRSPARRGSLDSAKEARRRRISSSGPLWLAQALDLGSDSTQQSAAAGADETKRCSAPDASQHPTVAATSSAAVPPRTRMSRKRSSSLTTDRQPSFGKPAAAADQKHRPPHPETSGAAAGAVVGGGLKRANSLASMGKDVLLKAGFRPTPIDPSVGTRNRRGSHSSRQVRERDAKMSQKLLQRALGTGDPDSPGLSSSTANSSRSGSPAPGGWRQHKRRSSVTSKVMELLGTEAGLAASEMTDEGTTRQEAQSVGLRRLKGGRRDSLAKHVRASQQSATEERSQSDGGGPEEGKRRTAAEDSLLDSATRNAGGSRRAAPNSPARSLGGRGRRLSLTGAVGSVLNVGGPGTQGRGAVTEDLARTMIRGDGLCRFQGTGKPVNVTATLNGGDLNLIFHKAMTWTKSMTFKLSDTMKIQVLRRAQLEAVRVSGYVGDRLTPGAKWWELQLKFDTVRKKSHLLRDHLRRAIAEQWPSYPAKCKLFEIREKRSLVVQEMEQLQNAGGASQSAAGRSRRSSRVEKHVEELQALQEDLHNLITALLSQFQIQYDRLQQRADAALRARPALAVPGGGEADPIDSSSSSLASTGPLSLIIRTTKELEHLSAEMGKLRLYHVELFADIYAVVMRVVSIDFFGDGPEGGATAASRNTSSASSAGLGAGDRQTQPGSHQVSVDVFVPGNRTEALVNSRRGELIRAPSDDIESEQHHQSEDSSRSLLRPASVRFERTNAAGGASVAETAAVAAVAAAAAAAATSRAASTDDKTQRPRKGSRARSSERRRSSLLRQGATRGVGGFQFEGQMPFYFDEDHPALQVILTCSSGGGLFSRKRNEGQATFFFTDVLEMIRKRLLDPPEAAQRSSSSSDNNLTKRLPRVTVEMPIREAGDASKRRRRGRHGNDANESLGVGSAVGTMKVQVVFLVRTRPWKAPAEPPPPEGRDRRPTLRHSVTT